MTRASSNPTGGKKTTQKSLWDQLFGFKRGSGAGNARSKAANARATAQTKQRLSDSDAAVRRQNAQITANRGQQGVTRAAQSSVNGRNKTAPAKKITPVPNLAETNKRAEIASARRGTGVPDDEKLPLPDTGYQSDPSVAAAIAAIGSAGGYKGVTFKGNLKSYIDKYKSMMPTVGYDKLIDNAKDQAATGDKTIQGVYGGLGAYIAGAASQLKTDSAEASAANKQNAADAVALLNSAYDSSRKSVSDQLAAIGGLGGVNPDPAGTGADHQQDVAAGIAERLQSRLDAGTADLSSRLNFNSNAGIASNMQGAESRASLQRDLAKMVAQYRTQQSQENAANATQALSLGTNQYNTDRSYAQSEAARAQQAADAAYSARVNAAQMAIQADNTKYQRWVDTQSGTAAAARAAQEQSNADRDYKLRVAQANAKAKAKPGPSGAQTQLYATLTQAYKGDPAALARALQDAQKRGLL